jgi:hypothetical protein
MSKSGRKNSTPQNRSAARTNPNVGLTIALAKGLRERARTLRQVIPELPPKDRIKQARRVEELRSDAVGHLNDARKEKNGGRPQVWKKGKRRRDLEPQ